MFHVNSVSCLSVLFALSILSAVARKKVGSELAFRSLQFLFVTRQNAQPRQNHRRQLQPFRWGCTLGQTKFSKETNMRKTLGVLCLLATLAISLLAAPIYADESVAPKRTVIASKYDLSKEVTLTGTVQSLVRKPAPGTLLGAHLMVSTAQGIVDAHIGNYLLAGRNPTSFASGQSVKLVGIMTEFNHHNLFLVRTIETENRTITVRRGGFLVLPASAARLAAVSSTGGAR
jgi:hypothetical protein